MSDEQFWRLIRRRRSVRRYADAPVPAELIHKLLEAAHWAPSAHNRQPWRFVILQDRANRARLARSMGQRWQADLLAGGAEPAETQRRADISILRITRSPLVILPCLDLSALDDYPDPARQQAEWQMGVQSVALAVENLLLAAQHYNLAACWLCAPIFVPDLVQDILDLPSTWQPQALLTIGYPPDDGPRTKSRESLEERILWR